MSRFTEADYPKLQKLLELKKTITLNCDGFSEDDMEGWVTFPLGDPQVNSVWGNFESLYTMDNEDQKQKRKRLRTFVQPDGEIGLEITYYPATYLDKEPEELEADGRVIYEATRLREVMTFEEFMEELKIGEDNPWLYNLFGVGGEVYDLIFEVVPAGRPSELEENAYEMLLEDPLWIQRKGRKYNIYIGVHVD